MRSMRGISRLARESFWCSKCKAERTDEDVHDNWRCPECNELIQVRAYSNDGAERIALVRKRASELREGDQFLFPGQLDGTSYRVLGISPVKNGLGVGLEGYGRHIVAPEEPVNCRTGRWTEA
jgi:DNA-directed RNA polymerase subunit RPC12/RpoP